MPIHDWTRVDAGIFHDFRLGWITRLSATFNQGGLPDFCYSLCEQIPGEVGPDILMQVATPSLDFEGENELEWYAFKQCTVVIRRDLDHQMIAMLDILSPGNKACDAGFERLRDKALSALKQGIHLLLVDLFPPTRRDPQGIHGVIWRNLDDSDFQLPTHKPLTIAAYTAGPTTTAYVEPVAVGNPLPEMPLFLSEDTYVLAPLEKTYREAYQVIPQRWRAVVEGKS